MIPEIKTIAVVGAGIMGNGIAQSSATAGYDVHMIDISQEVIDKGCETIQKSLGRMSKRGKITKDQHDEIFGRVRTFASLEDGVKDADLVIEAIPENLEMKKEIFSKMDQICGEHTILATNTSTISITAIAAATNRAEKVIGMHYANPVPVIQSVVLNIGMDTAKETIDVAKMVSMKMGKIYMINRDSPGFAGNRMMPLFVNEAFNVAWEKIATPEDIDKDFKLNFRHPMGPLELADFIGLDQFLYGLEYMYKEWGEKYRPSPLLKQLVGAGYYGVKTGRGVYKYDQRGKKIKEQQDDEVPLPKYPFAEGLFVEGGESGLIGCQCQECGQAYFPSRKTCVECGSSKITEKRYKDGAKLYCFTAVQMPSHKFKPPFDIGWVEFPDGVRVLSQIQGKPDKPLKIGMELELVIDTYWKESSKEIIGYKFQPLT